MSTVEGYLEYTGGGGGGGGCSVHKGNTMINVGKAVDNTIEFGWRTPVY